MAQIIRMPLKTDTMEEGVITTLFVKTGDTIESGQLYAEIETDKATMEWDSFEEGVILHVGVQEGDTVPVNAPVFILGEEGEDISELLKAFGHTTDTKPADDPPQQEEKEETKPAPAAPSGNMTAVRMRKMTDTMEEGVLASWLVKVGDTVEENQPIAEVETDKATMDFETYEAGTVLHLAVAEGATVPIDAVIAVLGNPGDDYKAFLQQKNDGSQPSEPAATTTPVAAPAPQATTTTEDERLKASPLAKKMAEEKGYDLRQIKGTGDQGRIVRRDVEQHSPAQAKPTSAPAPAPAPASMPTPAPMPAGARTEPVSQMRKAIARSLSQSKFTAPHFYLTLPIRMDQAIKVRKQLNELSEVKISFNDMIVKAAALALRKHPFVNASWQENQMVFHEQIHVGVAVAVEEGLLVPVVRHTDTLQLSQIAEQTKALAAKARNKALQPSDWEGSTFTISNLGMFGIEEFTAIINPPNACILAVGAIRQEAVVEDGQLAIGHLMRVTLSCDHRIVDGSVGAAFLQTLQTLLEQPLRML